MRRIAILALFGCVVLTGAYVVITVYDRNLSVGRMWDTPAVKPHENEMPVMESGSVPSNDGEAFYRAISGHKLKSPLHLNDSAVIKLGRQGYFTYCVHCHGKQHDGNGTVGQSFQPLPGDLRSDKVQSMPEGMLFKEISYGIPGRRQPPLATTIDIQDRWKIIAYLKSLGQRN